MTRNRDKADVDEPTTAVATRGETALATLVPTPQELAEVQEALAGDQLTIDLLPRIKTPAANGRWWDKDGAPAEAFEGVIILRHPVRVYWTTKYSGGGVPPDCSSIDNVNGVGNRKINGAEDYEPEDSVHECAKCPLAEFGTATDEKNEPTRGKACRQVSRMFIMEPGNILPSLLAVPPSAYKDFLKYTLGLTAQRKHYSRVVTKVGMENAKSATGIDYKKPTFTMVRDLEPAEVAQINEFRGVMLPYLNVLSVIDVEAKEPQPE